MRCVRTFHKHDGPIMERASPALSLAAASLSFTLLSVPIAAAEMLSSGASRMAEERLLGGSDEDGQHLACQPFTYEIGVGGVVDQSLEASMAEAGVPAAAMLEARQALGAAIDLTREVGAGDRFYVRYEQACTAEGALTGFGRVMWAELRTKTKGTVAIYRFRAGDTIENFWLANGRKVTPPPMLLPLKSISISSGFGLRADPFGKAQPVMVSGQPAPTSGTRRSVPQPARSTGNVAGNRSPPAVNLATPLGVAHGLVADSGGQATFRAAPAMFMHEGVDFEAPHGTPVFAAGNGVVVDAALNGHYGNFIRIEHDGRLTTIYGHLSAFAPDVKAGGSVTRGEIIGFVGNTGRSTAAHLHFEFRVDGKAINPIDHPEFTAALLSPSDLERFHEQVARFHEERDLEDKAAAAIEQWRVDGDSLLMDPHPSAEAR